MKLLLLTFLLAACLVGTSRHDDCSCKKLEKDETTYLGHESITVIESDAYKSIRGIVGDPNGDAMEDVLVEVFDNPKWIPDRQSSEPSKKHRIAACKTGEDGKFCFTHTPAGEYELVVSRGIGWNDSHFYIKIKPDDPKAKTGIELKMSISN